MGLYNLLKRNLIHLLPIVTKYHGHPGSCEVVFVAI